MMQKLIGDMDINVIVVLFSGRMKNGAIILTLFHMPKKKSEICMLAIEIMMKRLSTSPHIVSVLVVV
jgi:hypothetical protein